MKKFLIIMIYYISLKRSQKKYLYKYTENHTIIRICISVIIPYHIVDYYINTIDDMQNEKNFFYHCKKFEKNHDFEQFF